MSEIQNILRELVDEFDTLCGEFKEILKQWKITIQIQDSPSDDRILKLQLRFPSTRMAELKSICVAWQRKTDVFLSQVDPSRYHDTFLALTNLDDGRSLYNLVTGNSPWVFADWNYRVHQEENTYTLQIVKSGVPLKLTTYKLEKGGSLQEIIIQIEKFINTRFKEQLLESLEALYGDILAILRTYDSAESIARLIETYRIRSQDELLQQMREEGQTYLNEEDPPESKRRIICFIIRFLLEQELKNRYGAKIGVLNKSKMVTDLIKILNQHRILTDGQKATFEEINQLCNQAIHKTLPVPLDQIKEAFHTVDTFIWG